MARSLSLAGGAFLALENETEAEVLETSLASREEAPRNDGRRRVETISAIVMAIAAVATAWCAYQATRWNGIMATAFNEAGALRSESLRQSTSAGQLAIADVTIAADWLTATVSGNEALAIALRARMAPELTDAMNRWLDEWRPGQPLPEGGPFSAGDYQAPGATQAIDMERRAEARFAIGRQANQRSDDYVLTGVLFALTLFFAGVAGRFESPKHAKRMAYAGVALVLAGILLLLVQPKSIGL